VHEMSIAWIELNDQSKWCLRFRWQRWFTNRDTGWLTMVRATVHSAHHTEIETNEHLPRRHCIEHPAGRHPKGKVKTQPRHKQRPWRHALSASDRVTGRQAEQAAGSAVLPRARNALTVDSQAAVSLGLVAVAARRRRQLC
jgi:hypothetical protein